MSILYIVVRDMSSFILGNSSVIYYHIVANSSPSIKTGVDNVLP